MKKPYSEPLKLNPDNLRICLLQYNFFPFTHEQREEMPPIFGSEQFTPEIAEKITNIGLSKFRSRSGFDLASFKRTRHPGVPRILGIPHPKAHADLVNTISSNWTEQISSKCQSENSILQFEIQDDYRLIVHKYNSHSIDNVAESKDPAVDFGSNYRVRTDIANFYKSIYSHSLPWALVGTAQAKRERGSNLWYNQLDSAARLSQRNETKGITIGPATSSILSEIVLFPVDSHLRNKGYRFYRYIDDYTAFTKDRDEADRFLTDLSKMLEEYGLQLNAKKTVITEMPVPNAEKWVVEMNQILSLASQDTASEPPGLVYRQVRLIIDKAILLSDENPDGSVAKYAFSAILDMGIADEDTEKYVEDALLKYAYYYPTLVPLLYRWVQKRIFRIEMRDRIYSILDKSFKSGQSDNIVWCMFLLISSDLVYRSEIIDRALQDASPMVILMAYVYAKSHRKTIDPIKAWANSLIDRLRSKEVSEYDLDQYWIVLYQLFLDGEIPQPYTAQEDKKVFDTLKKEKVTFVRYDHKMLNPVWRPIILK